MYAVTRSYKGLGKQRREELADAIERELSGQIADAAGLHGFAVDDKGEGGIESTTFYLDKELAERASRRPPVHPDLKPDTTVREIDRGRQDK